MDWGEGALRATGRRLRLVLFVLALVALALAVPVLPRLAPSVAVDGRQPLVLTSALAVAAVFLFVFTSLLARKILSPARRLERAVHQLGSLYREAHAASLMDMLTGLGNHRAFQEELDRQLGSVTRYRTELALLLIDLDEFKTVNDASGHAAGDDVLSHMGAIIRGALRRPDRAFRIGGDEFALLLPHTDADGARTLGRRLLASALQPKSDAHPPISFSAGISAAPALASDRDELYRQADAALYRAKRQGRTSVEVFEPARDFGTGRSVTPEVTAAVTRAAAPHLLRAVYQPIVRVDDGTVIGYEGLVRPMEGSGFESPAELFATAELAGKTVELDRACIQVVTAGARTISPNCYVAVNVSPRTIEAPEFNAQVLIEMLADAGLEPQRVVLELTEREAVEDVSRLRRNLIALQTAGMRVAADDVGAGNAGLRLLSQMQFDIVKIDLSLIQDSVMLQPSLSVLRALNDLASSWGAGVIAEGVETPDQLALVREVGITGAQGYLIARPSERIDLERIDLEARVRSQDWLGIGLATPAWAEVDSTATGAELRS